MSSAEKKPDPQETDDPGHRLDEVEELLKRIPGAKRMQQELSELRALLVERRPPRVACVGRRGAGKSSLANALLGAEVLPVGAVADTTTAPAWVDLRVSQRAVRWFDTPGLRAGDSVARRRDVAAALRRERPDVLLFLCRATEVDAGIDDDLDDLAEVRRGTADARGELVPLIAAVTKVDELAPQHLKRPPYDADPAKRESVDAAVARLKEHLARKGFGDVKVVPVGAYQRWEDGALAADWRWNLPTLGAALFARLPQQAQVEAARAFDEAVALRRRVAMRFVGTATSIAVVVGATPLPFADAAVLLPLQSLMLTAIAYVSGRPLGPRAVSAWLGTLGLNVGAALGMRELVRAVLKVVPGVGGPLSGAVAGTGTWALGVAAVRYFVEGATAAQSREAFDEALRHGPDEAAAPQGDPSGEGDA